MAEPGKNDQGDLVLQGNVSFLQAVAAFYGAGEDEEEERDERPTPRPSSEDLSKAELQQECTARGIAFRKSWTKGQLREALAAAASTAARPAARGVRRGKPPRLSRAAQQIVNSLTRP